MNVKPISLLLFLCTLCLCAQQTKKAYFIGNSYTSYNNLPQLVANIAQSTGDQLQFQSHTPGGSTLQQHYLNPTVLNTIDQGDWDYVVLQEQSQLPSYPQVDVNYIVYPYAQALSNRIKTSNPCGTPLFYMTWGRKNGDSQNCPYLSYVCTYTGMDDAIRYRYEQMALQNTGVLSPVGAVWRYLRTYHSDLELYNADESHPSALGSMAAAYTFYTVIFKKDPTLANYTNNLNTNAIQIIKNAVKTVVFDHLIDWHAGTHDNPTRFDFVNTEGSTFAFTNRSANATSFQWNFGDGTTSNDVNPTHTYAQAGTYTVTLATNACGQNTTLSKTINVTALSTNNHPLAALTLFPNPTKDKVYLEGLQTHSIVSLEVFNLLGQVIPCTITTENDRIMVETTSLSIGQYFLKINTETGSRIFKILKH